MTFIPGSIAKKYTGESTVKDTKSFVPGSVASKYSQTTSKSGGFVPGSIASKHGAGKADTKSSSGLYNLAVQNGLQKQADNILKSQSGEDTKKIFSGGFISDVFDVLSALQYGVTGVLKGKGFAEGVKTRQSFADKDALGDKGIPGIIGGIALDIAVDPLTYIAPWTIAKKIPMITKGAKLAEEAVFGKRVTKTIEEGEGIASTVGEVDNVVNNTIHQAKASDQSFDFKLNESLNEILSDYQPGEKLYSIYQKGKISSVDDINYVIREINDQVNPGGLLSDRFNDAEIIGDKIKIKKLNKLQNDLIKTKSQLEKLKQESFKAKLDNVPVKTSTEPVSMAQELPQILRGTKGMTADNIMATHPDIKLKKDVPATDIHGNKVKIPDGEVLTPYELKGNKILLQDGETYIVSKAQFQNIKGQSVSKEVKEFAPEFKGLEETVKGTEKMAIRDKAYADFDAGKITREERNAIIDELDVPNETKYSQYQLPDGNNYKEILIKAPESNLPTVIEKRPGLLQDADVNGRIPLTVDVPVTRKAPTFKSSHWDEPNVISHLRMNERTYNGKKVAFMEELQSDWAREGRSKGFATSVEDRYEIFQDVNGYYRARDKHTGQVKSRLIAEDGEEYSALPTKERVLDALKRHETFAEKGIPNHPLLKNWQELSIKRALKEAVDNDAEYFAWINGGQTSARYNLATHVDSVKWNTGGNGYEGKMIYVNAKEGRDIIVKIDDKGRIIKGRTVPNDWEGKTLDQAFGKGLADKIMEKESGNLSGEGLKFGGEWANNLYDKQVGNIVSDLTGAKIEVLDLGLPIEAKTKSFEIAKHGKYATAYNKLTPDNISIGQEIRQTGLDGNRYIITDILGDGKFKAVPKEVMDNLNSKDVVRVNGLVDNISTKIGRENFWKRWGKMPEDYFKKELEKRTETFDISQKLTTQQGIKLTPEIKAKIRGEAPSFKASGKQFEDARPQLKTGLDKVDSSLPVARTYEDIEGGTKIGRYLAQKFQWMSGADPVFKETFERGLKNTAISVQNITDMSKGIASLTPEVASKLLTKDKSGRFIRASLSTLKQILNPEDFTKVSTVYNKIDNLGKEAVDLGLLSKKTYEDNIGEYIKNAYMEYETAKKAGMFGVSKVGIKGIKQRKAVEDIAEFGLTQVDNPAYLLFKSAFDLTKDVENAKIFKAVAEKFGTDVAQAGFTKMPDGVRLGVLAGKYVPNNMATYLNEIIPKTTGALEEFNKKLVGNFKFFKVVMNPATHARNLMSNQILNYWKLGMNPLDPRTIKANAEALQEIAKGTGKWTEEARPLGYSLDTFASAEMKGLLDTPEVSKWGKTINGWQSIKKKLGDLYQAEENQAKLSAYIYQRTVKNLNPEEAWKMAESATFNYAQVTPFVRKLRESLFGFPFITFTVKSTPLAIETALKHPNRISVIGKIKQGIENASDIKETARERANEPSWVKDGFYVKLPIKDKYGRSAYFDMTYILPFGDIISGNYFEGLPKSLMEKSPFIQTIGAIYQNKDFYGNSIWKNSDPSEKQLLDLMNYLTKTYVPPLIGDQLPGGYNEKGERQYKGIYGATGASSENQKRNLMQELLRNVGAKIQPIDADIQETYTEWNKKKALEALLKENSILNTFEQTYIPK